MSTRIFKGFALAALLLAGCEQKIETKAEAVAIERGEEARALAEGRIPCALGAGTAFDLTCTIDRSQTQDGLILTIRHPDGGFHRLRITGDGRGVVAADGAAQAVVRVIDQDAIEVAIDEARYRLPATIRPGAAR
ncbi:hypothetical protein [Sphingomonas turrisvirgatae]|uniref:Lipoprotein n=1 Tax=Sphingomonas turrisvirgatae TaxID=1888892 RepID=A0A1E3LZT9_9SPHN|nr:hypothetical protein [Sphingomonas turrisvirgatae]ODP39302.1 hypothetical protein BFL28_10845 [Sphingomonas turrisvirgatae]